MKNSSIPKTAFEIMSFLFIFFWLYMISMRGVGLYDDNAVYAPAVKVANGQILYKQAYTQYGPIMVYIQAGFIKLFGERLWSVRLSAILFYIISFIFYYHIFKKYLPYWLVLISAIILAFLEPSGYGVFHSWSSIYALAFEMVLILIFIKYIETHNIVYVFLSGLDVGIIFFCRQSAGIVFIIGTIILWIILSSMLKENIIKNVAAEMSGIIIVVGSFALYFYLNGCFEKWIKDALIDQFGLLSHFMDRYSAAENITNNIISESIISEADGNQLGIYINKAIGFLKCLFPIQLMGLYFFLPFLLVADLIYFIYCGIKKRKINIEFFIIFFVCFLSWHQYFPLEGSLLHIYWAAFPMIGLLAVNIYAFCKKVSIKRLNLITCIGLLLLTIPTLYHRITHSMDLIKNHNFNTVGRWTEGIKLTEEENQFFLDYYDYIDSLRSQYNDLLIYNFTSLYLPECELKYAGTDASAILYIWRDGKHNISDKYMTFEDSFPMQCEIFMELIVNNELESIENQ